MVHRMTTWTLNAVLASMAAAAVLLPSPDEIRKAIEYSQQSSDTLRVAYSPKGSVEIGANNPIPKAANNIEVDYPPAVDCLQADGVISSTDIQTCIPKLVDQIKQYDRTATDSIKRGREVYADPQIENARLAVISLCRANWVAQAAAGTPPDGTDCKDVTVGVAY
jgi:hypothetical protein